MSDLFSNNAKTALAEQSYTAQDIEVLEGLEPVRRRPGMYIGGSDETAMHHLVNEVFDNAMDEAVAGHASRIEMEVKEGNIIIIRDNGRGIPIDPHPKYPDKSALEVILTTLHSGGKFGGKAYETSGGLHGVGISVVNALSDKLEVEVARNKILYRQQYSKGDPLSPIEEVGGAPNRRGTSISFHPDPEIFGDKARFRADKLYKFARSKAYLFRGVEIRWQCDASLTEGTATPTQERIHFPDGLADFLAENLDGRELVTSKAFTGQAELAESKGRLEWAISWPLEDEGLTRSYCNTVHTPDGGTHENGLKTALGKGIRAYSDMLGQKKLSQATAEDMVGSAYILLSVFIKDPQFQGQTKDRLVSAEAARLVENAVRDHFDHWLSGDAEQGQKLIAFIVERMEQRLNRRKEKETSRKSITQRLRLPGKLADCTRSSQKGTEIFLVEGDSAGGSAKQARSRETQAILPLRGKILNVASATSDKIRANTEISDMLQAFGCGTGKNYRDEDLRYEKVIIMTDADVDGAHIASLLMTFFYRELPQLIRNGHLYLAQPPLYRISRKNETFYAADDAEKAKLIAKLGTKTHLEIGRFKGLGEMTPPQLKETTMQIGKRRLLQVMIAEEEARDTAERVEQLMGKKPELRFQFIQEQTQLHGGALKEALDV
jgi:topoisomerase-4 subunit B